MATEVGAANTLRASATGWEATNTDVAGFLAPLEAAFDGPLDGQRASVLGAGGSARAVVAGLRKQGMRVTVHARRAVQARELASSLGCAAGPWPPAAGSWDVLVNTHAARRRQPPRRSPLPGGPFGGRLVYDLTYGAGESALLAEARRAGCRALDGLPMLVAQAERQFEWWTGRRPRAGLMESAARGRPLAQATDRRYAMQITSFEQFTELAQRGTFVPVYKEIVADLLTPVSAFLKVAEHSDYAFLLESVEGGEQVARYSFLGKDPFLIVRARDGKVLVERAGTSTESDKAFVPTIRELMAGYHSPFVPGLPRFTGGAVGYLGYDAAAWFEPVTLQPATEVRGRGRASCSSTRCWPSTTCGTGSSSSPTPGSPGTRTSSRSTSSRARASGSWSASWSARCRRARRRPSHPLEVTSNVTKERFEEMVRTAKEYIAAGDIYQVVLSQRFEAAVDADPFTVYRALRHVNPSPYMYFLRVGDRSIVGSSPEMLVRVEGRKVQTHPIAGTRPRGRTEEEDQRLGEELKRNEKERAEHVMLVDLGRNDLGRVCEYGSGPRARPT